MEDNANYTYTYDKEGKAKPERSLKVVFAGVIAALAVLAVVLGIFFGIKSASSDNDKDTPTTVPVTEEITTVPAPKSPYNIGLYSVNTDGKALFFRKDHASNAEPILEIADQTELTIDEVYYDETAESEDYMYWGKTTFKGHTGWVAMKYMKKAYSDNVITPDDITTTEAETTTAAGETEATMLPAPSEENTSETAAEQTEATTAAQDSKYPAGEYTVHVGGSTLTMRNGAGTNNDAVGSIPDGATVSVTEVVDTGSSDENLRYWGKVSYDGHTGYVCMTYLR